jgi:hypothetical protein
MQVLTQGVADQYVPIYLVDSTDGYSPEDSVASPTIYLSKNGGADVSPNDGTWTEIDASNLTGAYWLTLDATDTDTVGILLIDVVKTGTSRHFVTACQVKAASTDTIATNVAAILADTGTDGVLLAATATSAALVDAVWDEAQADHVTAATTGKSLSTATAAADPWTADPADYSEGSNFGWVMARALGGSGMNTHTITVQDEDDNAIEGVRVDIYSSSAVSLAGYITGGETDSDGEVTFYLPVGTFYAFRYLKGYGFSGDPATITVTEAV